VGPGRGYQILLFAGRAGFVAVGDDRVLDPVVDCGGQNAAFEQIDLGAIGTETDDAGGPDLREAGDFEKLVERGVVDVDARFGRQFGVGLAGVAGALPGLFLRVAWKRESAESERKDERLKGPEHGTIVGPAGAWWQEKI